MFGDIKILFDSTVDKIQEDLHDKILESVGNQEQRHRGLEIKVQQLIEQQQAKGYNNLEYVHGKIDFIEKMLQQITYEQGELNSFVGSKRVTEGLNDNKELDIMNRKIMVNMLNINQLEKKHHQYI